MEYQSVLIEDLSSIEPLKKGYFHSFKKPPVRLCVAFDSHTPFGPSVRAGLEFLFTDFGHALKKVLSIYKLNKIELIGVEKSRRLEISGVHYPLYPSKKTPVITYLELKKLVSLLDGAGFEDMVLVSLFRSPGEGEALYVPRGTALGEVLEVSNIKEHSFVYNPLRRRIAKPDEEISTVNHTFFCSSEESYILSKEKINYFSGKEDICFYESSSSEDQIYPCCNCLSCAGICPSSLYPSTIYHLLAGKETEDALAGGLGLCVRCGKCSLICPSRIPLADLLEKSLEGMESV